MAYLAWSRTGLLCGHDGVRPEPIYTWTYSSFERYLNESITPSMYGAMAEYVMDNICDEALVSIQEGEYYSMGIESDAVDYYFDIPILDRIDMHEQYLVNLTHELQRVNEKRDAVFGSNMFDPTSPIFQEMEEMIQKFDRDVERLEREILEEQQWRGGHEEGAENISSNVMDLD